LAFVKQKVEKTLTFIWYPNLTAIAASCNIGFVNGKYGVKAFLIAVIAHCIFHLLSIVSMMLIMYPV